jgi:hypothetical protein
MANTVNDDDAILDGCGCPIVPCDPDDLDIFPSGECTRHREGCPQMAAWMATAPEEVQREWR